MEPGPDCLLLYESPMGPRIRLFSVRYKETLYRARVMGNPESEPQLDLAGVTSELSYITVRVYGTLINICFSELFRLDFKKGESRENPTTAARGARSLSFTNDENRSASIASRCKRDVADCLRYPWRFGIIRLDLAAAGWPRERPYA
jgi:hypothetical protein